jgi:hypothetical protein
LHQRILLENEKEKQDEEGGDEFLRKDICAKLI